MCHTHMQGELIYRRQNTPNTQNNINNLTTILEKKKQGKRKIKLKMFQWCNFYHVPRHLNRVPQNFTKLRILGVVSGCLGRIGIIPTFKFTRACNYLFGSIFQNLLPTYKIHTIIFDCLIKNRNNILKSSNEMENTQCA